MKVDTGGDFFADPLHVEAAAVRAEAEGYDGVQVAETRHDAFVGLTLAARATSMIELHSGIAVAFARNPMTVAVLANDLQLVSGGRFHLGLGAQVRAHIERRFAMPWSRPAARMGEFVTAVRAIWASWATGDRLDFHGEFYSHTLMTEFFDPGPNPHGNPPILLAAVGEQMTETAGRVADGVLCHSLTTERYLREVTLPALHRGRNRRDHGPDGLAVSLPAFVAVGRTDAELDLAVAATRRQIAFYGSTPAYRGVLDLHGRGELHEQLNRLSRGQDWDEMARAVDDSVIEDFAVIGRPEQVAAQLQNRFGDIVTRLSFNTPYEVDPVLLHEIAVALR
jgi:probable F420-dependent oxidoreductase